MTIDFFQLGHVLPELLITLAVTVDFQSFFGRRDFSRPDRKEISQFLCFFGRRDFSRLDRQKISQYSTERFRGLMRRGRQCV